MSKSFGPQIAVLHYTMVFKTTDGEEHRYSKFRYADPKSITCTIPEYIMVSVISDGYCMDDFGVMYPLSNVLSIRWEQDRTAMVSKNRDSLFGAVSQIFYEIDA